MGTPEDHGVWGDDPGERPDVLLELKNRLGIPGFFDVHVHFMPEALLERVWAYFEAAGPLVGGEWQVRYKWPQERRVAFLECVHVQRYSALAYAHRPGLADELTNWCLDFADQRPGCLRSGTFYPEPGVTDQVGRALSRGVEVFKLHLQVSKCDPNDEVLTDAWHQIDQAGTPVVLHSGHVPVPGEFTGASHIARLLERFPSLPLIIAHMGSPDYGPYLQLAEQHDRVYLDTTMAFTPFAESLVPFPTDLMPRLNDLGLGGKILLGSDFPQIPWAYAEQILGLERLGLGDDWLRHVLWENAAALFRT